MMKAQQLINEIVKGKDVLDALNEDLPQWPGADKVCSNIKAALEKMAAAEYAANKSKGKKKRGGQSMNSYMDSFDRREIIDALNHGDEEELKAWQFKLRDQGYI